jgi:hypothetical protein
MKEGEEEKKTRRYRQRKAGDTSAKGKRKNNVKAF